MRIGIDGRFYGPKHAGLGRYTKNLIDWVVKLDQSNEYVIFLSSDNLHSFQTDNPRVAKVLVKAGHYSVKEQLELPRLLKAHKLDLVHFPHLNVPVGYQGAFVVTIHDLIMHKFKNRAVTTKVLPLYELKHLGYRVVTRWAATRARLVLVPSQAVKQDITDFYHLPSNKIKVTLEAADDKTFDQPSSAEQAKTILQKYGLTKKFIIYVGNVYPHKNIEALAQAMKVLGPEQDLQLILPSARNVFLQRTETMMEQYGVRSYVILPGFVPDEDLAVLFNQAEAYVFPTLAEGFGLPPLEAMMSGLPVVCSDLPVLREVCGPAALYFDPHQPPQIVEQVTKLIHHPQLRQQMIEAGHQQASKFSWQRMAEQTLEAYDQALKN